VQDVFDFLPQGHLGQAALGDLHQRPPAFDPVMLRADHYIIVYAHREDVGFLEDHADLFAEGNDVGLLIVDRFAVEDDVPLHTAAGDQVVHAVEDAEKGGLAAAGRSDDRRDRARRDVERDVSQSVEIAVIQVDRLCLQLGFIHSGHPSVICRIIGLPTHYSTGGG
jgi:hypothetical protein